ncbi:MAG TPA: HNH endonuclease [Thermoanaerobaculia bacterium]|nr:HNH endonuclease [Thermoanaerobaculia bacterium]
MEVHHRIRLAYGGEDTVENAVALCPNCHREAHHG